MGHVDFIEVQIRALVCYVFLLLCFLGPVKEKAVVKFRGLLLSCVLWVTGSLCMRLQLFPGLKFWYDVSICGLFFLPLCFYNILSIPIHRYRKKSAVTILVVTILLSLLNIGTGCILAPPKPILVDGNVRYVYQVGWGIMLLLIPIAIYLALMVRKVCRAIRGDRQMAGKLMPFFAGMFCIVLGNLLMMIPGNTFPFDILSGFLNVLLIAYMLYQGHFFEITERAAVGVVYSGCAIFAMLPVYQINLWIRKMIQNDPPEIWQANLWVITALSMLWGGFMVTVANFLINKFVMRREYKNMSLVMSFQNRVNAMLKEEDIVQDMLAMLEQLLGESGIEAVLLGEDENRNYFTNRESEEHKCPGGISFASLETLFASEHMFRYLEPEKCNTLEPELAVWMQQKHINGVGCLEYEGHMQGYVFAALKTGLSTVRANQISSALHSAAGAIRNAQLYREVYLDSITDELTGVYNRKHAMQRLGQMEQDKTHVAVLHLDIDDFKLYNAMYGAEEGDKLLKWCVETLQSKVGNDGEIFRYGADEFLTLLPDTSAERAAAMGREIQRLLEEQTASSEQLVHYVSMSGGVASYPETAHSPKAALHQAEMATTAVKRTGFGNLAIYNMEKEEADWSRKSYDSVASTIYALTAAIDAKDNYTFLHSQKVSEYAVTLAKAMGYNSENVEIIREAGLLHDIGKISIPESILKKQGKLTEEEYRIMQKHVVNSIDVIRYLPGMDYVIPAVVGHHEKYDGTGYPRGLAGEEIPESARILAIADSFDAMTSRRPYKEPRPISYAVEELERCKGTHFDPILAELFIILIQKGEIHVDDPA